MSLFWDPKARKPQVWTYFVLIGLPIVIFLAIYFYGTSRVSDADLDARKSIEEFK